MKASTLAQALEIISKDYPDADVVKPENKHFQGVCIENCDEVGENATALLADLGFRYSDSHGTCWYAEF